MGVSIWGGKDDDDSLYCDEWNEGLISGHSVLSRPCPVSHVLVPSIDGTFNSASDTNPPILIAVCVLENIEEQERQSRRC